MHALETFAPARGFAASATKQEVRARALGQFAPALRPAVRALARRHPRLADLALSFPALLASLAHPRAGFDPEPAIRGVIAGWSLEDIARLADVPFWLRRLAPPLCVAPLPTLPDSYRLRKTIVNHLPKKAKQVPRWLDTVGAAARDGTNPYAVWCASELARGPRRPLKRPHLLALWAWHSSAGGTQGHALIERGFTPDISMVSALDSAERWLAEVALHLDFGERVIADLWFEPGNVDGYDFVPLATAGDISAEARAMENCLRSMGYEVISNAKRLWSVQRHGKRVATLAIERRRKEPLPSLAQIAGPRNAGVSSEVWLAAHKWVVLQGARAAHVRSQGGRPMGLSRATWRELWKPYWLAKGRIPAWLPLRPSRIALSSL